MNKKEDLDNFEWFNLNLTIDDQFFDDKTESLYKKSKLLGYAITILCIPTKRTVLSSNHVRVIQSHFQKGWVV